MPTYGGYGGYPSYGTTYGASYAAPTTVAAGTPPPA